MVLLPSPDTEPLQVPTVPLVEHLPSLGMARRMELPVDMGALAPNLATVPLAVPLAVLQEATGPRLQEATGPQLQEATVPQLQEATGPQLQEHMGRRVRMARHQRSLDMAHLAALRPQGPMEHHLREHLSLSNPPSKAWPT